MFHGGMGVSGGWEFQGGGGMGVPGGWEFQGDGNSIKYNVSRYRHYIYTDDIFWLQSSDRTFGALLYLNCLILKSTMSFHQ